MRTKEFTIILLIAILFGLTAVGVENQAGQPAEVKEISNTRSASCLVKVTCNPEVFPLNIDTIEYLMRTSAVVGKAAKVIELSVADAIDCFSVEEVPVSGGFMDGRLRREAHLLDLAEGEVRMREHELDTGIREMDMMRPRGEAAPMPTPPGLGVPEAPQPVATYQTSNLPSTRSTAPAASMPGNTTAQRSSRTRPGRTTSSITVSSKPIYGTTYGTTSRRISTSYSTSGMSGASATRRSTPVAGKQQSLLFQLTVDLLEEAPVPVAKEFMNVLVENLQSVLAKTYGNYLSNFHNNVLNRAEGRLYNAQEELDTAMGVIPGDYEIRERLEQEVVDLSSIGPEHPFEEAIQILKRSVDPPLNIVVMWRELYGNAEIEQTTPVNIEGPSKVTLGKGLELLLRAVSDPDDEGLGYQIEGEIITIPNKRPEQAISQPEVDTAYLTSQKRDLLRDKQQIEMELAGQEARREAIIKRIDRNSVMIQNKAAKDEITAELMQIVNMSEDLVARTEQLHKSGQASMSDISQAREKLARARMEMAKRQQELQLQTGGDQLARLNDELTNLSIDAEERQAVMQIINQQLVELDDQLSLASRFDPQAARIRVAKQALENTERRFNEVRAMEANLQEPMVVVIGAD